MATVNEETTKGAVSYTQFHPRWYRPPVSVYWWLGEWHYLKFILRELSSVFVAVFVIETLLMLNALRNGPEAYGHFQQCVSNPLVILLNVVSFLLRRLPHDHVVQPGAQRDAGADGRKEGS